MTRTFRRHYNFERFVLGYDTPVDAPLQHDLEALDAALREKSAMTPAQTSVGLLDLTKMRLAMIHPDRMEYAASIAKLAILLAYFHLHPESATRLDATTRHELGLMVKASSNALAAKFSRELGLVRIQEVLNSYGFYDHNKGGGIWMGKHYGENSERIGDPLGDNSHALTTRQLLRFYVLLEQGKLVSPQASVVMREILKSPEIPHDQTKFIKGLAGRQVEVFRKWGSWEDWLHDSGIIRGASRHYILVGLTHHPEGDQYLVELAAAVDDLLITES